MKTAKLQVKIGGTWFFVFCRNERTGIILTDSAEKAIRGDKNSLKYFQEKFADNEFRINTGEA